MPKGLRLSEMGQSQLLEIRRPEVNELLDGIVNNHGRSQADAVLAIVRGICNWYAANCSQHYQSPIVAKMKRNACDVARQRAAFSTPSRDQAGKSFPW